MNLPTQCREWAFILTSFDAGYQKKLRLSSILKLQQEAGERDLAAHGLSYNRLCELGFVFVVTRARCRIHRLPEFGERVRLYTWNRGEKGVQFRRNYLWLGENEEILIESKSYFALVDPNTHSLLRPETFRPYALPVCELDNGCPEPRKVSLPDEFSATHTRPIRFTDLDYNGHLNNTVYADFMADYFPTGMMDKTPQEFSIDFLSEALSEDTLEIHTSFSENTAYYCGKHGRGTCFTASCRIE